MKTVDEIERAHDILTPFKRTVCACSKCVACCKRQPGPLAPGDVERIEAFLGEPVEKYLVASRGSLVKNLLTGIARWVGTITPRFAKGRCVFLDVDDRCKIHPVAPFGCAYFDTHQGNSEGQRRVWFIKRIQESAEYRALRAKLPLAQKNKGQAGG